MKSLNLNYRKIYGFSLVEMAVVLVIVGLLMAGLLPMISGQVEQQRRTETRKLMEDIRTALVGYAASQSQPRLPCPATPSLATGSTNAGVEARTGGVCNLQAGVLPWVTLGIPETDAWNRRFTYAVPSTFAATPTTGFTLTSTSTFNVLATSGGITVASGVPAVIISHGSNGFGAYTPLGIQVPTTTASTDEIANTDGAPFVSKDFTPDFDDIVVWLSPNTLFNRMVAAGKLP